VLRADGRCLHHELSAYRPTVEWRR
jgi:hypothetical protein